MESRKKKLEREIIRAIKLKNVPLHCQIIMPIDLSDKFVICIRHLRFQITDEDHVWKLISYLEIDKMQNYLKGDTIFKMQWDNDFIADVI